MPTDYEFPSDYDGNPYYNPEACGLEVVATAEYVSGYEFDMRVVWRHPASGRYYTARDSGCSCPTPFEDYHKLSDLEDFNYESVRAEVLSEIKPGGYNDLTASEAQDFLNKIRGLK